MQVLQGVSCAHLSDGIPHTMVESSVGGSCRCQEEDEDESSSAGCCSPQVFTSVLLGILACVLMTGGVFLAFHRWDPLWLIVSGIGVVLILIGSILHCCTSDDSSRNNSRGRQGSGKGVCCGRPVPTEHHLHGHLVANNGSLTEQLLPLSNARSVSQLSLNMLPGYFPPVVTTYGIEQHSAVVQNINRIVQQQQLTQQTPGSSSPGVQGGPASGKSFILLSLPADTTQANIQNLVATVYQLEGSSVAETPATDSTSVPPATTAPTTPSPVPTPASTLTTPPPLLFKHVEVQTCNIWPNVASNSSYGTTINNVLQNTASTSTDLTHLDLQQQPSTSTASGTTQTEDASSIPENIINLMDCSVDIPPICDNAQSACGDQTAESSVSIPDTSSVLVDVTEPTVDPVVLQCGLVVAIPDSPDDNILEIANPSIDVVSEVNDDSADSSVVVSQASSDVLIDISDNTIDETPSSDVAQSSEISESIAPINGSSVNRDSQVNISSSVLSEATSSGLEAANQARLDVISPDLPSSCSNLSDIDGEIDDNELLERSSPPPSYDDATHEGESAIGAFGLAYGTI